MSETGRDGREQAARAKARWIGALGRVSRIGQDPLLTLPRIVDGLAQGCPDAPALLGEGEALTYRELAERSRRYARWALGRGLGSDDTVALMMPNRPDYVAAWLGISRTGATVALLNTGQAGASLAHSIDLVRPGHILVDPALTAGFADARAKMSSRPLVWSCGGGLDLADERLDEHLAALDGAPLAPGAAPPVTLRQRALVIYTSGTTSLPKAAQISHGRIVTWSQWFAGLLGTGPGDRMYDCLPMYHSIGGVVAPGAMLVAGGSVAVRARFSAGGFWEDVAGSGCTLFQYIGELCRFLLNAPLSPFEDRHRLRLCAGNGLRPEVWRAFQNRFAVPEIVEFYAATESTVSLYNVEGKVGAVGRIPPFMAARPPAVIVRHDPENEAPRRGPDGLCEKAMPGEAGELLGRIGSTDAEAAYRFEGYTDPADSEPKIVRDVLRPGDAWMRTGDLMRQDAAGFFFFVDRIGDTFRWHGENVSTTQVEEAIGRLPGIQEVAVYGVAVPGREGRAGMAAIVAAPGFDPATLEAALAPDLPGYARPVFLRVCERLAVTGTFKTTKRALAGEGYDPPGTRDLLYLRDAARRAYVPLSDGARREIGAGRLRL